MKKEMQDLPRAAHLGNSLQQPGSKLRKTLVVIWVLDGSQSAGRKRDHLSKE